MQARKILSAREVVLGEITAITPQVKDKSRCNIYIDGRFFCGLTLETAVKNRLKVGQTVAPERLAEMQLDSEKQTALDKALTHITACAKTEKQIRDFLAKKGFLPPVIEYVLERMRDYNFVNDREYAQEYTAAAARKKGGRLIRMELRAKGISDEDADGALDELDEESQAQAAAQILGKYLRGKDSEDKSVLQKAYRHLMSKGFEYEIAKSALATLGDLDEE
jgi:regulatory protein